MNYQYDTTYNVPIDIRHEAKYLTKEFGFNVIYVRNNKYVKCTCFDDLHKCGDPKCRKCFGSGFFSSMQKIPVLVAGNSPYSEPNRLNKQPIGVTTQKNEIVYIQQEYNPQERDVILKVTWDKYGYPVDIKNVYEIASVREMRGDDGRNELNGCTVNNRTDMVAEYNRMLKAASRKILHEMAKGGKGIWPMKDLS